ncbi:uncharacterized protein LY89DRAFT_727621 [Mollisia scopiformis]|uniref:Uncharacterized protein n=1 Tax=Mollisia scopiformis TaxID=149040 RepID=A0A194XWT3_MOLSC|nr:uncharacterized protein LY89DRAFT_727621 [Mollisia scopiformis]KUJ24601.1 hypothetical protein LY89DRAFT_727621 [Mollisia scopiformis]
MNTADGNSSSLNSYTTFNIGVNSIWKKIYVFIRPDVGGKGDLSLLLGLPWLHDVDAKFNIRESKIEIGDRGVGENIVTLQRPIFIPSEKHKLILHPKPLGRQPGGKIPIKIPRMKRKESARPDSSSSSDENYTDTNSYSTNKNRKTHKPVTT